MEASIRKFGGWELSTAWTDPSSKGGLLTGKTQIPLVSIDPNKIPRSRLGTIYNYSVSDSYKLCSSPNSTNIIQKNMLTFSLFDRLQKALS